MERKVPIQWIPKFSLFLLKAIFSSDRKYEYPSIILKHIRKISEKLLISTIDDMIMSTELLSNNLVTVLTIFSHLWYPMKPLLQIYQIFVIVRSGVKVILGAYVIPANDCSVHLHLSGRLNLCWVWIITP